MPYQALPQKWKELKAELSARGEVIGTPPLELYGHRDQPAGALDERERMTDQKPETYRLLELFRPAALVYLVATSGIVVWSFHNFEWPGFLAYLFVGFLAGSVAGGLVGVPLISSWAVMGVTGGLFECAYQGWQLHGWIGAVLGGLLGVVGGIVITVLLAMLMSLVLVSCGIDPFVNADTGEGRKTDAA